MRARVISAAILAPVAIVLTVAGGAPFLASVIAMCAVASWEATALFARAASAGEATEWRALAALAVAIVLVGVAINPAHPGAMQVALATVLLGSVAMMVLGGAPARRSVQLACGAATLAYVAGLGAHFVLLRAASHGLAWTLLACAVTWSTDIGAFFAGRRFGTRPFFQAISPKKTLEGAIGGLAAGALAAVAVAAIARLPAPPPVALVMGALVSAAAQAGDLFESLLKREAGVKDSGTLIPGHGGILDRIDSLLVAVTLTFYWSMLFP